MKVRIHNVDHGACAVLTAPNGKRLMIDCGRSLVRSWYPSIAHFGQRIDTLILQNLDEDHVEDLPNVWRYCSIGAVVSNPTIDAVALLSMKPKGMRAGVRRVFDVLLAGGEAIIGNWNADLGGIGWHVFWNVYGRDFTDTNNLSLATFVTFGGFTILFGGDMECAGWEALLRLPAFRARLREVKVFVASHHGRENGCCDRLFAWMRPELVIFSDGAIQYGTQERTTSWYAARTLGIPDYDRPQGLGWGARKVMTTRYDGTLTIGVKTNGTYLVIRDRDDELPMLQPERWTRRLPLEIAR